jgi:hypothetical protein
MFKDALTEPKEHTPNEFIYLVHGLLDWNGNGISHQEMKDKVNRIRDPNQFYRTSMIAHLDAESAKKRLGWCGGEVYQMGTFGNVGLIVDPARDGLVKIAWNCDLGSPVDQKELEKYVQQYKSRGCKHPFSLLIETKGLDDIKYNELILKGDKSTIVKGVFFKPQDSETEHKGRQLGEIVSEIMQTNVPVIELPAQKIKNHEDIKDPNEREMRRDLDLLIAMAEILSVSSEFYRPPELSRDRDPYQEYSRIIRIV